MAAKKKGPSVKKRIVRHEAPETSAAAGSTQAKPTAPERERPKMPTRTKEKGSGLDILKIVGFVIIALVVGSTILFNRSGGQDAMRGDKLQGESCKQTVECQKGSVCYSHNSSDLKCMKTCVKDKKCDPGYTCVSEGSLKRRKGFRIIPVCVEDDKL